MKICHKTPTETRGAAWQTNRRTGAKDVHRRPALSPEGRQDRDDFNAVMRQSREAALAKIPLRDLERLWAQLAPYAKRYLVAEDRHAFTSFLREWSMRGYSCRAFDTVFDMLKEEHRAEREASYVPRRCQLRQLYPEMYAPVNPGLRIVGRPPPLIQRIRAALHL